MFQEFDAITKEEWLQRVKTDLKGRMLNELDWVVEESLTTHPFYTRKDQLTSYSPLSHGQATNEWLIGERIEVQDDFKAGNSIALEGLKGGVQSILFEFDQAVSRTSLEALFVDIRPDFITSHFRVGHDPEASLFFGFMELLENRGLPKQEVAGIFNYHPEKVPASILKKAIDVVTSAGMPFKLLEVEADPALHADYSGQLAALIGRASDCLEAMTETGVDLSLVARSMQLSMPIGATFFPELAKLRALRILWANLLKAYEVEQVPLNLSVFLNPITQKQDIHANMIQAAIQGLCAVTGGAGILYIEHPASANADRGPAFSRRMARNAQHLLKMESYLDRVIDPGAGSYFIEHLTGAFAERAWGKFQKM